MLLDLFNQLRHECAIILDHLEADDVTALRLTSPLLKEAIKEALQFVTHFTVTVRRKKIVSLPSIIDSCCRLTHLRVAPEAAAAPLWVRNFTPQLIPGTVLHMELLFMNAFEVLWSNLGRLPQHFPLLRRLVMRDGCPLYEVLPSIEQFMILHTRSKRLFEPQNFQSFPGTLLTLDGILGGLKWSNLNAVANPFGFPPRLTSANLVSTVSV